MLRSSQSKDVFLTATLESSHRDGNLRTIEIIGIPGTNQNGKYILSETMRCFFDDLIAKPIFRSSRRVHNLDWKFLKIWLYTIDEEEEDEEYQVPTIDERDLEIQSNFPDSNLQLIYVLDNDLMGAKYQRWKKMAEAIFTPLFKEFVAPPELPSSLPFAINPLSQFIESLDSRLDPYAKMKRELFFDTLIIQID